MSHLYLPSQHNDTDLALASAVAEAIDSNELFVAWTYESGLGAPPVVKAFMRQQSPEPALRNPFAEALTEIAAAFGALMSLMLFRRPQQPAETNPPVRASQSESELHGAA
jgi:hypothetical protein